MQHILQRDAECKTSGFGFPLELLNGFSCITFRIRKETCASHVSSKAAGSKPAGFRFGADVCVVLQFHVAFAPSMCSTFYHGMHGSKALGSGFSLGVAEWIFVYFEFAIAPSTCSTF